MYLGHILSSGHESHSSLESRSKSISPPLGIIALLCFDDYLLWRHSFQDLFGTTVQLVTTPVFPFDVQCC